MLAAVGTAVPETIIRIVAILGALVVGGDPSSSSEIGVGAIPGAPFLRATLAMFIVGAASLGFRHHRDSGG
ncbi:MAG: hypothetical protein JOZ19_08215 [Rubrobacter sp.]|nr:hypothetical protein [Rubrobacter sp.]